MQKEQSKSRIIIAAILSLLTVIGGHLINRRLDRVILFFTLVLLVILIPSLGYYLSFVFMWSNDLESVLNSYTLAYQAILWSGLIVWLISLIVTIKDARNAKQEVTDKLTLITIISGVILAVVIGTVAWGFASSSFFFYKTSEQAESVADTDSEEVFTGSSSSFSTYFNKKYFHNYIRFGGYQYDNRKLEDLPEGEGYLSGKVMLNDEPVVGLELKIIVNNKYEKKQLKTDEDGRFETRLPVGIWYINRVDTNAWDNKPEEGDYILVSEHERVLKGNRYHRTQEIGDKGLKVDVTDQPGIDLINFTVKETVDITWPKEAGANQSVDVESDSIRWMTYPGAAKYHIKITSIKREGTSTSYFPVYHTVTENQGDYPLSNLKIVESGDVNEASEYGVEITAFTEDGQFLSESEGFSARSSFTLQDGLKVLDNDGIGILDGISSSSFEDTKKLFENRKRMKAIEILIGDGRLTVAKEMLNELDGPLDAGKKKALEGYLLVKQGKCEEANTVFEQAKKEGGSGCVPSSYKEGCKI